MKEIYAKSINGEDILRFELCSDGLYHWEGNEDYAGYTAEELLNR